MKKSKLITCLSAAFVSAMALMSCSSLVKAKSGVILTIDGVPYTAEDLFNDQKTPAAAEAKFNAVYKVAVRAYFKEGKPGYADKDEIARQTKVKMNEQKATAKSNADKNGTSYDVEWKKILKDNGVTSTKKLQDKFEYEFQKEKFEDRFYEDKDKDGKTNYDKLRSGKPAGFSDDFVNYFEGKQPYHMKHILVKISNLGDDNVTGTITKDESVKLYNVITHLAKGDLSFDEISQLYSDDETAKKDHASLGIMNRDTSFVDDFKLGTYLYEAFYGKATSEKDATYDSEKAEEKLFTKVDGKYEEGSAGYYANEIVTKAIDLTSNKAIGIIPYQAAEKLGTKANGGYADYEYSDQPLLSEAGISKDDFKDKYLPRNVIFNKYFNKHNIMVIAPTKLPTLGTIYAESGTNAAIIKNPTEGSSRIKPDVYDLGEANSAYFDNSYLGFNRDVIKNNDYLRTTGNTDPLYKAIYDKESTPGEHVLRDDNGRIILVFRSGTGGSSSNDDSGYQGIHFVVIERSPFVKKEYDRGTAGTGNNYYTTNDEYYTIYYPGQPGGDHPQYEGEGVLDKDKNKHTFANYIMDDPEVKNKKDRADKVRSELKNCMPNLNTFIYEHLLNIGEIQFNQKMVEEYHIDIKQDIKDWIDITREDSKFEKERNWDNNWQNYCYSLEAKIFERKETKDLKNHWQNRLVSEYCVQALTGATDDPRSADQLKHMFGVGGVFHD